MITKVPDIVEDNEVTLFSRLSGQWWNLRGPWAALHKFNLVRLAYICDHTATYFGRDPKRPDSLAGLRILDIGCGGGILAEPLARLGAALVGADPSESNIAVAKFVNTEPQRLGAQIPHVIGHLTFWRWQH